MTQPSYYQTLEENLQVFLEHWGPIDWRGRIQEIQPIENPQIAEMLGALAGIEDDAFYMQTKLRYSGTARLSPVAQFNAVWLVEEADHGRALLALAQKYTDPSAIYRQGHTTFSRDRRSIAAVPIMRLLRPYTHGMLAAYLTTGIFVEYVAITTYTALAQMVDDANARDILLKMSHQEGRHMRFYRKGAIAVMKDDRGAQSFVRHVMNRFWRPPGVDLYGYPRWVQAFSPLLLDENVHRRFLHMDELCDELPGQEGSALMRPFLARCLTTLEAKSEQSSIPDAIVAT